MQRQCSHRPDAGIGELIRMEKGATVRCGKCGKTVRFAGRRESSFVWLAAAWAVLFACAYILLKSRTGTRAVMWAVVAATVVSVPIWSALSIRLLGKWEDVDAAMRRQRRFHADQFGKDGDGDP